MATAVSTLPIDPSRTARIPVKISKNLLQDDEGPRKKQKISVQYNHWPKSVRAGESTITAVSAGTENRYTLKVEGTGSGAGTYEYEGARSTAKVVAGALFYNPTDKTFTLDRIDADFRFNLRKTPKQKEAAALSAQYPQLTTSDEGGNQNGDDPFDDPSGNDHGETPPDPSNPYDYRHFLNQENSPSPVLSAISSPVPNHHHHIASSPALSATSPRPHPPRPSKPKQKKAKASEKPHYLSPIPTRENPEKNGGRHDPDELVIDMGDAPQVRPWRSALGILNEGGRNGGPISLRSAASSMSPSVRGESDDEVDIVKDREPQEQEDLEEDDNDDVEEFHLGERAVNLTSPKEEAATPGNGWDDNQDGLEEELEEALGNQAEDEEDADHEAGGVILNGQHRNAIVNHVVEDSSSESEEE